MCHCNRRLLYEALSENVLRRICGYGTEMGRYTLCVIPTVVMFWFLFIWKLRLPMGLHSSCSTIPKDSVTYSTKYHDWVDAPQCMWLSRRMGFKIVFSRRDVKIVKTDGMERLCQRRHVMLVIGSEKSSSYILRGLPFRMSALRGEGGNLQKQT